MKYKWVEVNPGKYKLVDMNDPRPAVKLKGKGFTGAPGISIKYTPPWAKYEEAMVHPDSKKQGEATDKFVAEREHAMKTDPKAKKWEESRKAEIARLKPQWRKEMMKGGKWD